MSFRSALGLGSCAQTSVFVDSGAQFLIKCFEMKSSLCHQNFSPFSHDNYSSTARRRWANENIPMFTGTSARTNDGYISRKIITSIVWHPSRSNVILFGTRDGQISLRRIDEEPCPRVARLQGLRKRKSKYQYVNDLEWLVIAGTCIFIFVD